MRRAVIVGAGGHTRVLFDIVRANDVEVLGYVSLPGSVATGNMSHLARLGDDKALDAISREFCSLTASDRFAQPQRAARLLFVCANEASIS